MQNITDSVERAVGADILSSFSSNADVLEPEIGKKAVSYTHLAVYKRQVWGGLARQAARWEAGDRVRLRGRLQSRNYIKVQNLSLIHI